MTTEVMTVAEAVEKMRSASDVENWNEIRQSIKDVVGEKSWIHDGFLSAIDASGLIVEVLGA